MSQSRLVVYGNVDPLRVVDAFTTALADPRKPLQCPLFLQGCITALQSTKIANKALENLEILREEHHAYYDACIRFLTVPRSREEVEELQTTFERCSCNKKNKFVRDLHRICREHQREDSTLAGVIDSLIVTIHNAIQKTKDEDILHKVSYNAKKAAREGKNMLWPTKPQDILPYGADPSMKALIAWVPMSPRPITLGLLGSIMEICKKQVIQSVTSSDILPEYAVGIVETVWMTWEIHQQSSNSMAFTPAKALANLKRTALFFHVFSGYADKRGFMAFVECGKNFGVDRTVGMAKWLFDWLPRLEASVVPSPHDPPVSSDITYIKHIFQIFCALVHHYFQLPPDEEKYTPLIVASSQDILTSENLPAFHVYGAFLKFSQHHSCFAPGCTETYASAGREFSNCGGCGRVPYCSKACQVRVWRHETVSHKTICKKLRRVAEATLLSPRPESEDYSHFATMCALRKEGETLDEISAHVKKLFEELAARDDDQPRALPPVLFGGDR